MEQKAGQKNKRQRRVLWITTWIFFIFATMNVARAMTYSELSKRDPEFIVERMIRLVRNKRYATAAVTLSKYLDENPFVDQADKMLAIKQYAHFVERKFDKVLETSDQFRSYYSKSKYFEYSEFIRAISSAQAISSIYGNYQFILTASEELNDFLEKFPDSQYKQSVRRQLVYVRNIAAEREIVIALNYSRIGAYTGAIPRLLEIVYNYRDTEFVPEALHNLRLIFLAIKMPEEANKYLEMLQKDYPNSPWATKQIHV